MHTRTHAHTHTHTHTWIQDLALILAEWTLFHLHHRHCGPNGFKLLEVSPSAAHVIEVACEIAGETLFYPSRCAVIKVWGLLPDTSFELVISRGLFLPSVRAPMAIFSPHVRLLLEKSSGQMVPRNIAHTSPGTGTAVGGGGGGGGAPGGSAGHTQNMDVAAPVAHLQPLRTLFSSHNFPSLHQGYLENASPAYLEYPSPAPSNHFIATADAALHLEPASHLQPLLAFAHPASALGPRELGHELVEGWRGSLLPGAVICND